MRALTSRRGNGLCPGPRRWCLRWGSSGPICFHRRSGILLSFEILSFLAARPGLLASADCRGMRPCNPKSSLDKHDVGKGSSPPTKTGTRWIGQAAHALAAPLSAIPAEAGTWEPFGDCPCSLPEGPRATMPLRLMDPGYRATWATHGLIVRMLGPAATAPRVNSGCQEIWATRIWGRNPVPTRWFSQTLSALNRSFSCRLWSLGRSRLAGGPSGLGGG